LRREEKPEKNPQRKGENQQTTLLTYAHMAPSPGSELGTTEVRGERSPLRHPCFPVHHVEDYGARANQCNGHAHTTVFRQCHL
jgi:hypothetical protein